MTQVELIRSFIAVDISADVRAALGAVTRALTRAGADARWVRPESMHATLKFLGDVEIPRLESVRDAVASATAGRSVMQMHVRGIGGFPSLSRPRVLWAGLQCPGLAELAGAIEVAIAKIGFEPEERPFNGHITLARLRSLRGWEKLSADVRAHADDEFGCVEVGAINVFRSILRPDGAVHSPLWTIPLAQHK